LKFTPVGGTVVLKAVSVVDKCDLSRRRSSQILLGAVTSGRVSTVHDRGGKSVTPSTSRYAGAGGATSRAKKNSFAASASVSDKRPMKKWLMIEVSDTGAGISKVRKEGN